MNITLEKLLSLEPSIEAPLANGRIKLVRHALTGDLWKGFNKILRFDKEVLAAFTAEQGKDIFKDIDLILVFVSFGGGKALLGGAYWNEGLCEPTVITETQGFKKLDAFRKYKDIPRALPEKDYYFSKLRNCDELADLNDRLVIDWGGAAISWHQKKLDKQVDQILPNGFVSVFPGWDNVLLTHQELCAIIGNEEFPNGKSGNPDWTEFLTSHHGVYLITDTKTGQHYVGSASGQEGIWGRWSGYVKTGHNGNDRLIALLEKEGKEYCRHFAYSLHHVFSSGSITKEALIGFESLLKEKLGSRAFGLNAN